MSKIIEIENVCKDFKVINHREGLKGSIKDLFSRDYKIIHAVNNISISIKKGEIVGYLGPNGAGKSTTIKMMTGVLEPTSGKIIVNGNEPYKNRIDNAKNIGVVFGQRTQLWWSLPLIESFRILKEIYCIKDEEYDQMIDLYRSLINLDELLHKSVRQMSLGQRTLSDILAAFLHNPEIVFLDEPTIGLDVSMKSKIRELIHKLNQLKKTTVILTTHDMGDVDALCKRIVIIDKGKVLYDNDIEKLKTFFNSYRTLMIRPFNFNEELVKRIKIDYPNLKITSDNSWISILIDEKIITIMEVLNSIQHKYKICDMQLQEISTEHIIRKIYEGGIL